MPLVIATWNVNSIRARLELLLGWLRETAPDIALLQETKVTDDNFPRMEIEDLGYNLLTHGQKTYNGVAILSRFPLEEARRALPDSEGDDQARYLEAVASLPGGRAVRVASVYVPNGQDVASEKFPYKLRFLERLRAHLQALRVLEETTVIGGDYNVAPYADDVYDPVHLDGAVCYHPLERERLRAVLHQGYYDAYRLSQPDAHEYSWWDYRAGAFQRDQGFRIDHLLLSPQAADRLVSAHIDKTLRALDKASDHAPVLCTLDG
ncbi:MAG: exodeoxyribonuclease III [Alphaproteobacteria bacterium]|nr:exodeoxyribonuclease III [Alphaproteobacteria bacterium]